MRFWQAMIVEQKQCSACGQLLPTTSYRRYSDKRNGKLYTRPDCPRCEADRVAAFQLAHPIRNLITKARNRAKGVNLPCTITEDDLSLPALCPVFGVPLVAGKGVCTGWSPTIDRIDTRLGYIPGNVQVISHKANTMKHNATPHQLIQFAKWILRLLEVA